MAQWTNRVQARSCWVLIDAQATCTVSGNFACETEFSSRIQIVPLDTQQLMAVVVFKPGHGRKDAKILTDWI